MYVHALKLENIKAFDSLDLEFVRPATSSSPYAGLNVFVGGNSSGKSTLLKCIAMALSGPIVANQQLISPDGWVRRNEKQGTINLAVAFEESVKISEVGLIFEAEKSESYSIPGGRVFTTDEAELWRTGANGWMLGAYGPLRRLMGSSNEALSYARTRGKLASCLTLFREDATLSESEFWLRQEHARTLEQQSQNLPASTLIQEVQKFLNDGLLPEGFRISKVSVDQVLVSTPNGGELPMSDLSDGCRSILAMMLDILYNMTLAYPGAPLFEQDSQGRMTVTKPGVILIDEMEVHLHPSWQRLICEWLKTRFPNVQFFITTHSPLIAQAADEGGLFVLPLPDEIALGRTVRRLAPHEQQRITLGSAEKVLLGEAFGLEHTWSARAQKVVEQWERLAAQRNAQGSLPPAQQQEYERLSEQVEIVFDDLPEEASHA